MEMLNKWVWDNAEYVSERRKKWELNNVDEILLCKRARVQYSKINVVRG